MVNAAPRSGTWREPPASVTVNVAVDVAVAASGFAGGVTGPTAVAWTFPWVRVTATVSPWTASAGCPALARTMRPVAGAGDGPGGPTDVVRGRARRRRPPGRLKTSE